MHTPILIVGAGPTGLVLALSLARRGVAFRIVDDGDGPGEHSRAMVVHARTLEFYRQLGIADDVLKAGIQMGAAELREANAHGSHDVSHVSFADLGGSISPYPFALCYPQDDHEKLLVQKLEELGVEIEWRTKFTTFGTVDDVVHARLQHAGGDVEHMTAQFLCGCDGAHSAVRQTLGIGFPGGTYEQLFYVADVCYDEGFNTNLQITLGERIFVIALPVRSNETQRLIGLVPADLSTRTDLTFEDVRGAAELLIARKVKSVNWFATYRVHHRVAAHFRMGCAFLLGDAGHIHSPAGGQGMNTGIGDAINLAWKLAEVVKGRANDTLLDTYEGERIGFARNLVDTTDRAFTPLVASGLRGETMRRVIAPLFFTVATRMAFTRHAFFKVLSQTRINYDESALSEGKAGGVHGGDRLPWVQFHTQPAGTTQLPNDNFESLQSLQWEVHVYGVATDALRNVCRELRLPLQELPFNEMCADVGIERNAMYLVRPDGYVALAAKAGNATALDNYVDRLGLSFPASPPAPL